MFSCRGWLEGRGVRHVDAVLIASSGKPESCSRHHDYPPCNPEINAEDEYYGELRWNLKQPWAGPERKFMLLPVSKEYPDNGRGIPIFAEVRDRDWIKLVQLPDIDSFRQWCFSSSREKTLMYIARYVNTKHHPLRGKSRKGAAHPWISNMCP